MAGDGERDTRRKRFDWESQSHMNNDDQSLVSIFSDDCLSCLLKFFVKPFGRPGGGAPRRTDSGKLQASIISDPATRFQRPFKKDVDHVLVYQSYVC